MLLMCLSVWLIDKWLVSDRHAHKKYNGHLLHETDVKQDLRNCIFQVKEALKSSITIYDVISVMDHTGRSLWKDVF